MAEFVNASPKIVFRGTEDNSTRTVLPERDPLPQHLPLFYIFAQKGSTKRIVTAPAKLVSLYGAASFELDEKYYNHQTRFLSLVSGTGNTVMVQRLVPEDAKKANAIVYLNIIKDDKIAINFSPSLEFIYEADEEDPSELNKIIFLYHHQQVSNLLPHLSYADWSYFHQQHHLISYIYIQMKSSMGFHIFL